MGTALLVLGIVGAFYVLNARYPRRDRLLLVPSFIASWLTIELAPWWLLWELLLAIAFVAGGALDGIAGPIGVVLVLGSATGLAAIVVVARRSSVQVTDAVGAIELDPDHSPRPFPTTHVVFPFLMDHRRGVTRVRNITFGEAATDRGTTVRLRLDVTKPADAAPGDRRPGILQIHGGAWCMGDKRHQGIPLLNHLAANGWVGINANYRLSPRVGYPEHLVDCKRAVAWWREHAEEHGGDPDFLCVTGGSAGGHLSALVGLTAGDARYQPGFEHIDTAVRAAVPFYGVYDFTNRLGTGSDEARRRFFEPFVMKRRLVDDPEAFAAYSPFDQVRVDAPPFLVIHGSLDTLAPVEDAREFVRRLRAVSRSPVLYAEMAGAQHAFDVFPSHRTARVIEGVERFLHAVHRSYAAAATEAAMSPVEAVAPLVEE